MVPGQLAQAVPVEFASCATDNVSDVSAVEALAKVDEQLRRNELLGSEYPGWHVEQDYVGAAVDPRLIDRDDGIAHAGDQVDVIAAAAGLGQPHRIANLDLEAVLFQMPQRLGHCCCWKKQVQVFCVTPNASVVLQGKGAGHNIRYIGPVHVVERFAE